MKPRFHRGFAIAAMAALLVSACGGGASPTPAAQTTAGPEASATPADMTGWPYAGTLRDGSTFTLHPRVVEKLANGEPINYLFNYGSTAIPLFSPQYCAGLQQDPA